jgi:hypothetical protein
LVWDQLAVCKRERPYVFPRVVGGNGKQTEERRKAQSYREDDYTNKMHNVDHWVTELTYQIPKQCPETLW